MDCYSHPADMIIGPKAANQQGSLGKFGCTPRYVRLHIHASRGGRGLPIARHTASPHFHQDTQGRGGLAVRPPVLATPLGGRSLA